ncbi:amino acid ABC transporter permease [Actinocorallia sp. A-T 12471]|uniref:amino acid ABC transporter permease n=1 Tax=Actinocorallia sp. A-T 12471 TaxID=3089813 RepID=UPI0029D06C66|nr:amino acid ABC transporter permease [Actinocorallia sp. A-T 12471]MDX6740186.1 amino acid ABC transporter permease [Actinocorallia sp. A-T 12471]
MTDKTAWVKSDRQRERERLRRRAARRSGAVATGSTVALLGIAGWLVVASPGWPTVRATFFSWSEFTGSLGDVLDGFWTNVQIFLIAEPIVLAVGLAVALARGVKSPAFFPIRALAVAYTDVFRGIPTILLVYLVGFGIPALNLSGAPNSPMTLGIIALVLSYGAYVAEVFRAGIASVHPSQLAAARSLGLSRARAMRYVVLPQAVRNVVPPLLNDFASLQKDTALVAVLGVVEALRQAQIHSALTFNYTPYLASAALFVMLTVPLARFTDWLAARADGRRSPGDR